MNIRRAVFEDRGSVRELLSQLNHPLGIEENLFTKVFEQLLEEKNSIVLVLEESSKILGYISGSYQLALYAQRSVGFIDEIVIDEEKRGAGLGTQLVAVFEEELEKEGCVLVSLATVGAKPFYAGLGYKGKATYLKKSLINIEPKPNGASLDSA